MAPYMWVPAWLVLALHSLPWAMLWGDLVYSVPFAKSMFLDFGTEVPRGTLLIIQLSDVLVTFPWLGPVACGVILAGHVVVDVILIRKEAYRGRLLWGVLGLGFPTLLLAATVTMVRLPYVLMFDGLR